MKQYLRVNEMFGPTIQGEGKSAGKSVIFVRLAFCNLRCVWCDTPHSWNYEQVGFEGLPVSSREKETVLTTADYVAQVVRDLDAGNEQSDPTAVVVSGGEPLLQQKGLLELVRRLRWERRWIEIETNATITPNSELVSLVDQFNCSPKLSGSGNPLHLRTKSGALEVFSSCGKANFKFVLSSSEDGREIVDLVSRFNLKEVYVMPEGRTCAELEARREEVVAFCEKHGFNYCPRLHIELFGSRRGV